MATSEHVASKPMPATSAPVAPASFIAARVASHTLCQIAADDCCTKSGAGRQIGNVALPMPRLVPLRSKIAARALAVPTSMPR